MKPGPRFSSQTQIDPRESFWSSPRDDVTICSSRRSHPPRIDRFRMHDARANWSHFCVFKCHPQGFPLRFFLHVPHKPDGALHPSNR